MLVDVPPFGPRPIPISGPEGVGVANPPHVGRRCWDIRQGAGMIGWLHARVSEPNLMSFGVQRLNVNLKIRV